MAKMHFKYATMNSGKSIDLMRTAFNYEENGFKVLVMKPKIDTKADNKISSRIGLERKVDGKYTLEGEEVVIDGKTNAEYKPLCGSCFLQKVKRIDLPKIKEYISK